MATGRGDQMAETMKRDDQMALVEYYFAVCTRSLAELRNLMHTRIAQGTFDAGDAEFLQGASRDVIAHTHNLQIEAALAELPALKDLH